MEYILVALLVGAALVIGIQVYVQKQRQDNYTREVKRLRQELKGKEGRQRSVIKGQLAEQMYPLSEHCPYLLSDMRFMGMPIDYVIFDGYTETKDGDGYIREIIFADVKTGHAKLSAHQRAIRDAVQSGRVRWETINL